MITVNVSVYQGLQSSSGGETSTDGDEHTLIASTKEELVEAIVEELKEHQGVSLVSFSKVKEHHTLLELASGYDDFNDDGLCFCDRVDFTYSSETEDSKRITGENLLILLRDRGVAI